MFEIVMKPMARSSLRRIKPFQSRQILDAIERHLRHEPERPSKSSIKRLRRKQRTTYRLRVGDYRIFYDVEQATVIVSANVHKSETSLFYEPEKQA